MILVTGATGSIGQYLVRHLTTAGAPFKALVRDEAKGQALGCDYVVGDFDQPATLRAALAGVDRLFLNGPASPAMVRQQQTAIDAAKSAGVARIVKVSAPEASPTATRIINQWHGQIDASLEASGVGWALLQPGYFMQNFLANTATVKNDGKLYGAFKDGRVAFIDCDDIAACGAALLTGSGPRYTAFVLTGPEALTLAEVARTLSAHLGTTVTYVDLPVAQVVASMVARGMPVQIAENLGALMTALAAGAGARTTTAVEELTGRAPRTFDAFVADNVGAFR